MPSQGVTNVANAIINKINNLISSHNSNNNAHQDIRNSIPKIFYAACDCSEQNELIELECEDWNTEQGNIIYVRFNNVDNHDSTHVMFLNINEEPIPVHNTTIDFHNTTPLILFRDAVVKFTCYFIDENTPIFLYKFSTLTSELYNDIGFITSSSVPSASSTTPSADTQNGGVGTGTTWARSDHTHPKSSLYAESTHRHSDADITTLGFYGNLPQANYEGPSQQQVNFAINSAMGSKEDNANKVTSLSSSSTDTQYPSAKAVYDAVNGFITSSQIINNDNFCGYKTLIALVNEQDRISAVSFEDSDFDIIFTINPNIEEDDRLLGVVEIGDTASNHIFIQYSNQGMDIETPSGNLFNIALNMNSENIVKIKQDQSTNDLTFTVNNHELVSTDNPEIPKNIVEILSTVGTVSNFRVKTCTRIMTEATKNLITTSFTPSKLISYIDFIENDGIVNNHNSFTVTKIDLLEFDFGCQNNEYYEFDITTSKGHLNIYDPKREKKYCELYRDTTYTIKITHDELLIVKGTTVDGTTVVDLSNSNGRLLFNATAVCQFDFSNKKWYHEATFFDKIYPIGSVHITTNSVNPSNYFDGEWERIQDTFLLASGTTYENGTTGGSATVTLTSAQSGVPAHSHKYQDYNNTYTLKTTNRKPGTSTAVAYGTSLTAGGGATERTSSNNTAANASQAHENMPPYLAVYMWERVG